MKVRKYFLVKHIFYYVHKYNFDTINHAANTLQNLETFSDTSSLVLGIKWDMKIRLFN